MTGKKTREHARLEEDARRVRNWKRWGPYLSERQWGTVREDYSGTGASWAYFPHDHARSRTYRWGEDGLLGICDRQGRLCFAVALWNGRDPILKERLFGLNGLEGNHGEDVKECYFYLDSTPTHSYMKALYKYPQREYPYAHMAEENARRGGTGGEYELLDTGIFDESRYFDVFVEYAKNAPDDILVKITVCNRGSEEQALHVLPTLWFRNTWSWGRHGEGHTPRPRIKRLSAGTVSADHASLGRLFLSLAPPAAGDPYPLLFTENETNNQLLFGSANVGPCVKDAFHRFIVKGESDAVNPSGEGTKMAAQCVLCLSPGEAHSLTLRVARDRDAAETTSGAPFERVLQQRREEADEFYSAVIPEVLTAEERQVARQSYAGLLWTKQFYHYAVREWLEGDPAHPAPPASRLTGRNHDWEHLYNRDVISMPDKWEYPWYAAWDLAFHMIPFAHLDPSFAKEQLLLLLREWYMHPNGQIPAYEWAFSDVNPPVHAWAVWRVYKMTGPRGQRDTVFLARAFQKLLLNFTWWVNRKDPHGRHVFGGGFLGLDNIGVFDRSRPLPVHGHLEQADGTAWMAFYCAVMLSIALELAGDDPVYEDLASKFFEHFIAIIGAMNSVEGSGLWDETDGFYYDHLHAGRRYTPIRVRSMVGLLPVIAVQILEDDVIDTLPGFKKRMQWFLDNREDLTRTIIFARAGELDGTHRHRILSIVTRERLRRILRYMLDENEFLSPYGLRSLSRFHESTPYTLTLGTNSYTVRYTPAESDTALFGGNSNWRGPIWFPLNYLIIEALERYHHFYGNDLLVEFPTGSGRMSSLDHVAGDLAGRLASIFLPDHQARRPVHGAEDVFARDPHWRELVLFYEYFHGDSGKGLGASHQTGWTSLVVRFLEDIARERAAVPPERSRSSRVTRRRAARTSSG
jgi:hypothetical protein